MSGNKGRICGQTPGRDRNKRARENILLALLICLFKVTYIAASVYSP